MNSNIRNSIIISALTGLVYFSVIRWPSYFSYYLLVLILIQIGFWLYNFKVKLTKEEFIEKIKFIILPLLFNLGFIFFLASLYSDILKYAFLALVILFNYFLFIALKKVHNLKDRAALLYRNVIVSGSFFTILFSLSAIFHFYVNQSISATFRVPLSLVVLASFVVFYSVSYFLAFENGVDLAKFRPYLLVTSLLAGELTLISLVWIVNYPVYSATEKGNLSGLPLPAILLTIIFYFIWGVFSHKIDKSLTKRVIIEYVLFTLIFVGVLLITAKWLPNF